ncbi:MAG: histidine kinase dimerization/phosphoacceptor domain -containing protein [bacterium]
MLGIVLLVFIFPIFSFRVFSSVEKEQYPGSFTCKQVDSLLEEAQKYKQNNIEQYKYLSNQALMIAKGLPCKTQEAAALLNVGSGNYHDEKYYNALTCYFEAADLYKEAGNIEGTLMGFAFVVDCYLQIDEIENAFEYVKKIEKLLALTSNPYNFGRYYLCEAQYYYKIIKLNEAENATYKSIYYFSKAGANRELQRCLKMVGDIKLLRGDYIRAIYFYQLAIERCISLGDEAERAVLYTRLSHVYQLEEKYDLVLKYNFMALGVREKVGTKELLVSSLINIGGTFMRLGIYDSAFYYLNKGIKTAKNINRTILLEHAYLELSRFYTATGNSKLALENYINYSIYHRKLIEDQNDKEIRKLEDSRKIREAEIRNELLKKENELQRLHYRTSMIQTIMLEMMLLFTTAIVILIYILRKQAVTSRLNLIALNKQLETDIEERQRAEAKLRESEQLFRFLAEHSVDVITHMDKNLSRKYISPSCKTVFGYEPHELLNKSPMSLIDPRDHDLVNSVAQTMKNTRAPGNLLYRIIAKDGTIKWVDVTINPIFDPDTGELKELLSTLRDVSERVLHEEAIAQNARQKEILLREIHTRVKNNFAVLISLMDLQKESAEDPGLSLSLTDLQLRVRTMSLVHEQLYISENIRSVQLHQYLSTLVNIISNAYEKERITLQTDFRECLCDIEMALPLGLIVNELLTNAFKYAFPGNTSGTVQVSLEPFSRAESQAEEEEDLWVLKVCDDGIGLPEFFTTEPTQGMGSQIVRILVNQIEAKLTVVNRHGACFTLVFPNSREAGGTGNS